jgi:hypothetical protein
MIVEKKITFTVQEITDKGATVLIKFIPNVPEGVTWDSPGDPLFVTVPKTDNYLSVGDTFDGPAIAKLDDGVPVEE